MSEFEIIYQTDPSREKIHGYEKHLSIEVSDGEYLERKELISGNKIRKDAENTPFVCKCPDEETMSPLLKEKFKKAREQIKENPIDIHLSNKCKIPRKNTKGVQKEC